jgi:hypothetical protein
MPSTYQKVSLNAVLGLFLDAQGHALPAHTLAILDGLLTLAFGALHRLDFTRHTNYSDHVSEDQCRYRFVTG